MPVLLLVLQVLALPLDRVHIEHSKVRRYGRRVSGSAPDVNPGRRPGSDSV